MSRSALFVSSLMLSVVVAVACDRAPETASGAPGEEEVGDSPAELVPEATDEERASADLPADRVRQDPLPEEIYYNLDDFDWHRQALPIVHAAGAYEAADTVLVISTLELDSLGRFGGVLYWGRSGQEAPDTVFVPVFEGYWLPFVVRQ